MREPKLSNRALISGVAKTSRSAALRRLTMSEGVPRGKKMPFHSKDS